jgi:hypothetical protein
MAAVEIEEWCSRKKEAWLSSVELDVVGGGKEELSPLGRGKHLGSCSGSHLLLKRKNLQGRDANVPKADCRSYC